MNVHIEELPSIKSRGIPRRIYTALELLGDSPVPASASIVATSGLTLSQVNSFKALVEQAGTAMT